MKKILVISFICMILLVSMVSAMKFDNVKNVKDTFGYTEKYKDIEIENWLGLGETLWKGTLKSNTETCGSNCKAIQTIELTTKGILIEEIIFKTKQEDGKWIEEPIESYNIQIKVKGNSYEVNDYEYVCDDIGKLNLNNSKEIICENKLVGTHTEYEYEWVDYVLGTEMEAGIYEVKLTGEKDIMKTVDWIYKTQGVELTEWADWGTGGTITQDGLYTVHTFLTDGSFVFTGNLNVELLIVAGGGGGGESRGGGGGAGGLIYNSSYYLTAGTYPVVVGTGGGNNVNGTNSSFDSYDAMGGGRGGGEAGYGVAKTGANGGSGGGAIENTAIGVGIVGQGYNGASGLSAGTYLGGGGGGAGGEGVAGTSGGTGGIGLEYNINGSDQYYAGGGGAGGNTAFGVGGSSIGGDGSDSGTATDGVANTGSGGGGGAGSPRGDGGSGADGIVIIRYLTNVPHITVTNSVPVNNANLTSSSITFGCNLTGVDTNITSVVLNITDGTMNWTQTMSGLETTSYNATFTNTTLLDGDYSWNCVSYGNLGNGTGTIWGFEKDATSPLITINAPTSTMGYGASGGNETLNWIITDTNFDAVWFSYNGTNTTLVGVINSTTFALEDDVFNLTLWANDSVGNINSSYINWTYNIWKTAESYSDPVPEGSEQTFYINVTSGQATLTPYLIYNGTSYLGTYTQSGSDFYCERDLDIPPVSADTNVTFYWSFLMADASVVNGTDTNLTVTNFAMDNCTANTVEIMNLLLREEEGTTLWTGNYSNLKVEVDMYSLDGVLIGEYDKQWINQSNVSVCVGNLTGAEYDLYTTAEFEIDDYVHEFYFIDKRRLNTSIVPITINLYDLLSADSTSFLFNYFDEDGLTIADPIIHTWRKYIGEGLFREVERSKQNEDGDTIVHLVEEDVIYFFEVSQNDTVVFTSQTYTALCDDAPCTITLEESGGFQDFDNDWDLVDNGAYTISSSAVTRKVNLTFATTTASTFNLTVFRLDDTGEYEVVGSDETTGTSGAVEVTVPAESGNVSFFATVEQDDVYLKSHWVDMEEDASAFIGTGLAVFLGLLIIMCLGLMAISEGSGTVVFVILGMFLTVILGLIDFGMSGIGIGLMIYFIVTGGIIIWKLTRRNR